MPDGHCVILTTAGSPGGRTTLTTRRSWCSSASRGGALPTWLG